MPKKLSLMTHLVAGYPSMPECERLAETMLESGVSFLEIQIPFSDPVADGPTIEAANHQALEQGVIPDDAFALMKRLKQKTSTPLLFMSYYNVLFRYGLEAFCKKAKSVGCYGLIIPDMPIDEEPYDHYLELCRKYQLHPIQVISPLTPVRRLKKIGKVASGFVYAVASFSTTGEQQKAYPQLESYLKQVRRYVSVPIAVGFGFSQKEQVQKAARCADIVVMGSKIINLYNQAPRGKGVEEVKAFLDDMNK
ncbi:MAG: tryptophan synthase subunit alpha [Candidatus Gracilibacteria bacterium]